MLKKEGKIYLYCNDHIKQCNNVFINAMYSEYIHNQLILIIIVNKFFLLVIQIDVFDEGISQYDKYLNRSDVCWKIIVNK